jgi:hypothetical protein
MARSYHIDIAAFAADCDLKWIDNLLSHFSVAGVESAKQGVARRLSIEAIQTIVLVRSLNQHAGLSIERGLQAAERLLSEEGDHALGPWVELRFDGSGFKQQVDAKVSEAVESIVPRRRGRPPGGARRAGRK